MEMAIIYKYFKLKNWKSWTTLWQFFVDKDATFRLGPRSTRQDMGRLEITMGPVKKHGKEIIVWSGLCGDVYSPIITARLICQMLGYPSWDFTWLFPDMLIRFVILWKLLHVFIVY